VKEGWIDIGSLRFISPEYHKTLPRSRLRPGDILVTKTGVYFGKSAVVPEEFNEANTIAHVGIIRLKPGFDARYVSTFLNSKYGYSQLRRRGIKATRPEIKLVEFADIEVIFFSSAFENAIHRVLDAAASERLLSLREFGRAEQELVASLGLANWTPPEPLTYIASSKVALAAGRLDAQYFMPAKTFVINELAKLPGSSI